MKTNSKRLSLSDLYTKLSLSYRRLAQSTKDRTLIPFYRERERLMLIKAAKV